MVIKLLIYILYLPTIRNLSGAGLLMGLLIQTYALKPKISLKKCFYFLYPKRDLGFWEGVWLAEIRQVSHNKFDNQQYIKIM